MMEPQQVNEFGMRIAKKLGVDEAVLFTGVSSERMVRFANDSVSISKDIKETGLTVYLSKGGKRVIGASSNPEKTGIDRFVRLLFKSLLNLPKDERYVALPTGARKLGSNRFQDSRLERAAGALAQHVEVAIGEASRAGAKRAAGTVESTTSSDHILTSAGTEGHSSGSKILLNIRAFTEKEASGHGLSCSATLRDFDPGRAGATAGEHAKRMRHASQPEGGTYQVLMSPTVAANLLSLVGEFASAFSVEAGTSYLADMLGKKVASESVSVTDHGVTEGCLEARTFDDEAQPTQATKIIDKGVLRSYLHNLSTAKRFGVRTTGNAGIIDPSSWNIEIGAGDSTYDEMVREIEHGIVVTSNWYTRFKNYRTGEFSTVPRDGAYLVSSGEIKEPVTGLRVSDSLQRMFSSVRLLSKEREWIQWWEVDTPTLCPWVLVDGVTVTRAFGDTPAET